MDLRYSNPIINPVKANAFMARTAKKYECANFESLFRFGGHCEGFTTDRTLKVLNGI